jgi:hypothetical protein
MHRKSPTKGGKQLPPNKTMITDIMSQSLACCVAGIVPFSLLYLRWWPLCAT